MLSARCWSKAAEDEDYNIGKAPAMRELMRYVRASGNRKPRDEANAGASVKNRAGWLLPRCARRDRLSVMALRPRPASG
jgi:hypothetical protein